ncbi:uncharacterized protein SPPG_02240 [Spizellomyces punctatus DAOM BR117]|uniref:Cyclin N-terminal domain-containing protein n=1 Tax=Spizellomyces punctatus (strain DAOM BR117) TaxID=645134 RepID=A0A0L0HQF3_SPIPD|nr:uncharacterized protein SPPG_02240 [Spizellomyces punctatus DAOM BR117]KND03180.1 hypothetical protein SPPG_02240 [Spizellomyces punctatus DAOM BR117]|eukprot:XP_016611219.1 hypothetical protein SPPG_02240 [Spizellomyces punctatus DAOM BR117]
MAVLTWTGLHPTTHPHSHYYYKSYSSMNHHVPHHQPSQRRPRRTSPSPSLSSSSKAIPQLVAHFICLVVHRTWPRPNGQLSSQPSSTFDDAQPHPSFLAFVNRIVRMSGVSSDLLFLALLYIIRLRRSSSGSSSMLEPTSPTTQSLVSTHSFESQAALSEARLVTAAIILAQKVTDDNRFTNKTWAELTGFVLTDVNQMEADFLARVDFRLHVGDGEYAAWVRHCKTWARQLGVLLEHGGEQVNTVQPVQPDGKVAGYYRKRKAGVPDYALSDTSTRKRAVRRPLDMTTYPVDQAKWAAPTAPHVFSALPAPFQQPHNSQTAPIHYVTLPQPTPSAYSWTCCAHEFQQPLYAVCGYTYTTTGHVVAETTWLDGMGMAIGQYGYMQ